MLKAFGVLARFKFLRGSALDPFGHSAERRLERELIEEYEANVAYLLAELNAGFRDHVLQCRLGIKQRRITQ